MAALTLGGPGQVFYFAASIVLGPAPRPLRAEAAGRGVLLADLARLVGDKSLTPVIAAVHDLADVAAAHLALETGGGLGKHVIRST
jgi:NADPH:quinone reductase-like Zn-dependent oxidoreductase